MQYVTERRAHRTEEDADTFPHTDLRGFKWDSHLNLDHCDLLLDAMDAQLDQLQVEHLKHGSTSRELNCNDAAYKLSQSLGKDTGLGSSSQTNDAPMSCLELMHSPSAEQIVDTADNRECPVADNNETIKSRDESSVDKEAAESRRQQVLWRLERLLGDGCKEVAGETQPPSESVCTEDFFKRFSEEMVELTVPRGGSKEQDAAEESGRTEVCHSDAWQTERSNNIVALDRGTSKTNIPHRVKLLTDNENVQHNKCCPPKARRVAGVPVLSFDTVSIDSDLDTVCTEQVRQHVHESPGWQALIQRVTDLKDPSTTQSDCDTLTQEESEPLSTAVPRASYKKSRNTRETFRRVCPLSDSYTDEEINPHKEKSEMKSQSHRIKLKARLSNLRQECDKEEAELKLRRDELRDVELCLTELQQKKKRALQGLKRLSTKRAQMEKEKMVWQCVLKESRVEKDCICCELQELQRQKESTSLEVLQRAAEETLRNRCTVLEQKHKEKKAHIKALEVRVSKLQDELGENKMRVNTHENLLAQKELQLLDSKKQCHTFQTEIDEQKRELQHLKTQHDNERKEAQKQTHEMMRKEEEINLLKKSLQQQEEAKRRAEEVLNAVKEERVKWDAEMVQQQAILEEQNREKLESWRNEIEQERSVSRGLQHEVVELKSKVQQLETECCVQQREQESLLAVIYKSLREEHQAEMQRLQKYTDQSRGTVLQLQQDLQLAVKETDRLRAELEEKESSHNQVRAGVDEEVRVWAQQLDTECQHLHLLLEQNGNHRNTEDLGRSLTVAKALQHLKTVREQLRQFISGLHQQLDSEKQSNELLKTDKERELSIQRQQLTAERDQALNSVKERLIKEHIEELSSLNWAHMSDGATDEGGAAASLRRQLRAKDFELQQVQRSMAQWKEQTTARLACKFEEELTAELERCKAKLLRDRKSSKSQNERPRNPLRPEVKMIGAKEALRAACSPCLHAVVSAAPHSPLDVASLKLLSYLQSRVKQLRLENQSFTCRRGPSETVQSGSYVTAVIKHPSGHSPAGTSTLTESVDEHQ